MAEMPRLLERATPHAPNANIWYPALVKRDALGIYPLMIWSQPWFSKDGIHNWPPIIDADRVFIPWDKRIAQ